MLIDNTNVAKADNYPDNVYDYDRYQYPDYECPDSSSMYSFYFVLVQINFTTRASLL